MRTLRFHEYGDPAEVLRLEDAEPPRPGPGQVRIAVETCGLTPADWALCGGLFAGELPRGIGLEVSGTVDAVGEGVTGVEIGDPVLGPAPFLGPTAGASGQAVLDIWFPRPAGLDPAHAAALPMAVETAYRGLADLGVTAGTTLLVSGAGTTVGFAAVQIAKRLGAEVIATAGETYADALRATGAEVTGYGEGLADRVKALAGGPIDLVLDLAPRGTALPELVKTVTAPDRVLTQSDLAGAGKLGVRLSSGPMRNDVLGEYAQLAAEGRFSIPIAAVYPVDDWRTALERSRSGHAHGKLVLRIG
ncbi:NADP-dependent oxidoreductase [Rugosimonospora acidiphila]|uniref:NADP-dependent oxidoreductase n=1 Tax=Rugosimonospora acidiphila TaxID=556531 RepID=A0ABP9SJG2_9ACTN